MYLCETIDTHTLTQTQHFDVDFVVVVVSRVSNKSINKNTGKKSFLKNRHRQHQKNKTQIALLLEEEKFLFQRSQSGP